MFGTQVASEASPGQLEDQEVWAAGRASGNVERLKNRAGEMTPLRSAYKQS